MRKLEKDTLVYLLVFHSLQHRTDKKKTFIIHDKLFQRIQVSTHSANFPIVMDTAQSYELINISLCVPFHYAYFDIKYTMIMQS